jgi:hypothetical protein
MSSNKSRLNSDRPPVESPRLVISVKEARKLLGKPYAKLADEQVEDIITKLYLIAKGTVEAKSSIF